MTIKKDPRRVKAGKKAWRTRQRNKKTRKNPMSKKNPNPVVKDVRGVARTGWGMVLQSIVAIAGSFAAGKSVVWLMDTYGEKLPMFAQKVVPVAVPVVGGASLAYFGKGSKIAQDAATGMVIAGVSTGVGTGFKALKGTPAAAEPATEDLSDAYPSGLYPRRDILGDSPYMVTPTGRILGAGLPMAEAGNPGTNRFPNMLGEGLEEQLYNIPDSRDLGDATWESGEMY